MREFEKVYPRIFGAVLEGVAEPHRTQQSLTGLWCVRVGSHGDYSGVT